MILFISDLHLCPQAPALRTAFSDFLAGPARQAEALYILGDLFEAWIGDEMLADPWYASVADEIHRLAQQGTAIGLLHGNRDFLLGENFAAHSGIRLLPDPFVLSVPTWQFVLSHGDALCTDDTDYQQFRAQVRNPGWLAGFLTLPINERLAMAQNLRQHSQNKKSEKSAEIMDVNPGAVEDFLRTHGYATLIHGHTHRPSTHDHIVDGIHCQRWVLSDWRVSAGEVQADYLTWDGEDLNRCLFSRLVEVKEGLKK